MIPPWSTDGKHVFQEVNCWEKKDELIQIKCINKSTQYFPPSRLIKLLLKEGSLKSAPEDGVGFCHSVVEVGCGNSEVLNLVVMLRV